MPKSADANGTPTNKGTRKVVAGGLAGAISALIVGVLNTWYLKPHNLPEIDAWIASSITTIVTAIVSWNVSPGVDESIVSS